MNVKFEEVKIKEDEYGDYVLAYTQEWEDYRGERTKSEGTLACWEMAQWVVTMGEVKIENYILKNFKCEFKNH